MLVMLQKTVLYHSVACCGSYLCDISVYETWNIPGNLSCQVSDAG